MKKYISKIFLNNDTDVSCALVDSLKNNKVIHCVNESKKLDFNYYTELAKKIGELAPMEEDLTTGNKNGNVFTDIKHPVNFKSSSYSHSNTRQPLHTDGSYESNAPNITFFGCLKKANYGGATIFIENDFLIEILKFYDKNLLCELLKTEINFYKGNDSKKSLIIDRNNFLNWNYHRCDSIDLTEKFHIFLENVIIKGGLFDQIILNEGDALFFKDNMVLHGRNSFIGERWLIKGGIHERL